MTGTAPDRPLGIASTKTHVLSICGRERDVGIDKGEAWSTILGTGGNFQDYNNPRPVVQVGARGSTGVAEISDIIFSTRGPGMWYSHTRRGNLLTKGELQLLELSLSSGTSTTRPASKLRLEPGTLISCESHALS